ncbi:MAG: hypothetical protein DHS20C01_07440 [marine bacterium B5-7]|nr:MAG: hypothetical protein DHS20C01_07440 [marine bacterium B5-7]
MRVGNAAIALRMADKLEAAGEEAVRVGFARAQAHLLANDADLAKEVILELLRQYPDERERIFNNAAEVFSRQPVSADYLDAMQTLADAYPEDPHGFYALAYLANRSSDSVVLDQAINRTLELDPDWEQAAVVKFVHLLQIGQGEDAGMFAGTFLTANPDAVQLAERYGRTLAASGDFEGAYRQFRNILRVDPDNSDILIASALIQMQLEHWSDARKLLLRHLDLNPDNDETRMLLARAAYNRKRYDEAIKWYAGVRDESLVFDAQVRIADALEESEGPERALEHLTSLVPISKDEEVRLLLAQEQILRSMGRLQDALALIDGAIREIPDDSDLLYSRGLLYAELDQIEQHETDIRRVIELDPDNAHAYNALGYTLADQTDRYDEAYELIAHALELAPQDPFILDSMGWVQYRLGDLVKAEDYLRRAFTIRSDAEIAAHLGEVLWITGSRDEARSLWQEALKAHPDNVILLDTLKRLEMP